MHHLTSEQAASRLQYRNETLVRSQIYAQRKLRLNKKVMAL